MQLNTAWDGSVIDGDADSAITGFLASAKKALKRRTRTSFWRRFLLASSVDAARAQSSSSNEAIARAYDTEYAGKRPSYGYASAILFPEGFSRITGMLPAQAPQMRILDVGAGSNEFLRFCRDELSIPSEQLVASDISPGSCAIATQDGFECRTGRLETLGFPAASFDLIYLSYFIDYDTDQSATFTAAIELLKSGGRLVLEGWFPVRPFALLPKDREKISFITRGNTADEDIQLVAGACAELGTAKGKNIQFVQVLKTHRFVQSHYGFNKLPSYFLTFTAED